MKKLKNVFLLGFLICISFISYKCIDFAISENVVNMKSIGSAVENKMPEEDFFKSSFFRDHIVKSLIVDLEYSVADENNYSEEEDGIYDEYTDKMLSLKEYVSRAKEESKNNLSFERDIDFIAVNNVSGEIYTNTDYSTVDELKNNTKGYYQIEYSDYKIPNIKIGNNNYSNIRNFDDETTFTRMGGYKELDIIEDVSIYISVSKNIVNQNYYNGIYMEYQKTVERYNSFLEVVIPTGIISAVLFVIYIILNYKLPKTQREFWNYYNKIPLEIVGLVIVACVGVMSMLLNTSNYASLSVIPIFILLFYLMLLIKQISNFDRKLDFLETSLIFKFLRYIFRKIKSMIKSLIKIILNENRFIASNMVIGIAFLISIIEAILLYAFLYNELYLTDILEILSVIYLLQIVFLVMIIRGLLYLDEIFRGVKEIKEGNLNYKIKEKDYFHFGTLARNINNIGEGLEKSIEEKVKSERMKSELITNVSHDLKTPLTSIINYVELIKREKDIQPEYLSDYVNVLDQKSKRLKVLIEDLFEASKASTGNIDLELVKLDLKQLVAQTIGEVQDKLDDANLTLKLNMISEHAFVLGDGKRLYRVVENLLSNICKYSLANSRVYVDLFKEDKKVVLVMKNISSYELDFDVDEITERFKRGDESRNTEGSGLGLSIARDLVKLHGGDLKVEVDADLFKVKVTLDEFEDNKQNEDTNLA